MNNLPLITYQKYEFSSIIKYLIPDNQLVIKLLTTIRLSGYGFPMIVLGSKIFKSDN